ncbi:BREX system P-loop protein BrxC [Methanocella sp. MCL-LM]|uniref:BREX system P-loop protein BrxC n=1 Tax=Methanocella sp. MCL-LM TaxID=3412035 RepID=UPI003C716DEC
MLIKEIFETKIEDKIEPVIKVGERNDDKKLASEIGSYVVTPTIEGYLDDFLEHYSDTYNINTEEIGVWISGYFGSGKSHLAKIASLLIENRMLDNVSAAKRFESRVPTTAPRHSSIIGSLSRISQCDTQVLAFNLNTLTDSKNTPLPKLLLSQYYQSKGYCNNLLYAKVIESELDKRGKLNDLHAAVERLSGKKWDDIKSNIGFHQRNIYRATCEVAPEFFSTPEEVDQALKTAEQGEITNIKFVVQTILDDLKTRQRSIQKTCRFVFVLDEAGQWIEDDSGRLAQLQALVEEAASAGQGKIWTIVTTHADMGTVFEDAKALKGDMKKIEGRFRFKWNLTTENIELVLEDRIFKKNILGRDEVIKVYNTNPGVLRGIGQLANTSQKLPDCIEENFVKFYPFFPYQIHLIPEVVKNLRSAGGRGEQLSGSTRTLIAITQDIMRGGRRKYLDKAVGEIVSFDEVYDNLAKGGEINPEIRKEFNRIEQTVPDANSTTRHVAEVLYLIRELSYIPRTLDNLSRLLVEHTTDDLSLLTKKIEQELNKLIAAKLVAKIGEEYEFLTGERRTFEEEVSDEKSGIRWPDLESGLSKLINTNIIGFDRVPYKGREFPAKILMDDTLISKDGHIEIKLYSPLAVLAGKKRSDIENQSLFPEERQSLFVLSDRISEFDEHMKYYLAMQAVITRWKGDPHKSEDAHKLASNKESKDLKKLEQKVVEGIKSGLKHSQIIFRGSTRTLTPKQGQSVGEALRQELSTFWQDLYPKYEKVPVVISSNEQKAIIEVLSGSKSLPADVRELKLFDKSGQVDTHCALLDEISIFLSTNKNKNRIHGKVLLDKFEKPEYGWDPAAVRIGVAALVRAGAVKIILDKKVYMNPADVTLQDHLRNAKLFDKTELEYEELDVSQEILESVRALLIRLTGKRKIEETPSALSNEMDNYGNDLIKKADVVSRWADPAELPLPKDFVDGKETYEKIIALTNPVHKVNEIYGNINTLEGYSSNIKAANEFVEKWGQTYKEMSKFALSVGAIEHLLTEDGPSKAFLRNWETAKKNKSVINGNDWKNLLDNKAAASLEIENCIGDWRNMAREIAQKALDILPQRATSYGISAEAQKVIAQPLETFMGGIEKEANITKLAALPLNAEKIVKALDDQIDHEHKKLQKATDHVEVKKPIHRIKTIKGIIIENEEQWRKQLYKLDQEVTNELKSGNKVELV